jgi:transposase InsO family protein
LISNITDAVFDEVRAWKSRLRRFNKSGEKSVFGNISKKCGKNGSRRIQKSLGKNGVNIGRRKVRVPMKENDLKAIRNKAFKPKTTDSKGVAASNLLAGINLAECGASKIIIGDITYIRLLGCKFCYLAVWQDKVTPRIIGWSLALEMTQELVMSGLTKAICKGLVKTGAIIHSDG